MNDLIKNPSACENSALALAECRSPAKFSFGPLDLERFPILIISKYT